MAIARWARLPAGVRLVYEARGLFADERVEIGSWGRGSLLDRAVRHLERENLRRADGLLVVMSDSGREELERRRFPLPLHRVLPNSVDTRIFTPRGEGKEPEFGLAYCGSLGGWYMTEEMVVFARVAAGVVRKKVLFLTPHADAAWRAGADPQWAEVRTASPADVPAWLRRARATFFLIRPSPGKRASSPTKVAESLAAGLPVVANRGVGDLESILEKEGVGVLLDDFTEAAYRAAAERLVDLLDDSETPSRCRRLAESRFSLDAAVGAYYGLYRELTLGAAPAGRVGPTA
jgi:glycosyltransferase involved in cell wall biosynthesis